ncbi:MAG: VOC family protein [Nocardioides sp.]|uniref:VOC family protein n=1 Tax=Nocardioides sp. TaxID=35761 RepID=UPI003266B696
MASRLNPYLNVLDGKAREALEFYQSVLGGSLNIMTFGDMGTEGPMATQVMHGQLETTAGYTLMVADAPPEMVKVTMGTNISVSLSGGPDDAEMLRGYFAGLAEGGRVNQPLEAAPWGDEFGMLVDKFGISWLMNIAAQG